MNVDMNKVAEILDRNPKEAGAIIAVLQDFQREFRYLPVPAMVKASEELHVPLSKVYSIATFYNAFSLTPRGEKVIRICKGTACHIKGADKILEQIEAGLKLKPGETSADLKYTVEVVNCVGACAMAPVMIVNDKYHGKVRCDQAMSKVKRS